MNKDADSKVTFKFLDAKLLVHRVMSNPAILFAHNIALREGGIARLLKTKSVNIGIKKPLAPVK
jgi:hypothetical protein